MKISFFFDSFDSIRFESTAVTLRYFGKPTTKQHWTRTLLPKWGNTQSIFIFSEDSTRRSFLFSVFVRKGMSTDTGSSDVTSSAMEQTEFLELATDSASLINIQSLNSIFVKSGFDRPDFIIKPTREKVHVTKCCLSPLASSVHSIWLPFNFISPWRLLKFWFSDHNFYSFLPFYDLRNLRWTLLILEI